MNILSILRCIILPAMNEKPKVGTAAFSLKNHQLGLHDIGENSQFAI